MTQMAQILTPLEKGCDGSLRQKSARTQSTLPLDSLDPSQRVRSAQPSRPAPSLSFHDEELSRDPPSQGGAAREQAFSQKLHARNHPHTLPPYYGTRFAGRRQHSTFENDSYNKHFVGPTEFNKPSNRGWASDLNAQGKEPYEGVYGPRYAGMKSSSNLGNDGWQMTTKDGPSRFLQSEQRHCTVMRQAGRPHSSATCVRAPALEQPPQECLNPRIGKPYALAKKHVPDPRNGIGMKNHGDKLYGKPECMPGYYYNFVEDLLHRKFVAKIPKRPISAPSALLLHNKGLKNLEKTKRREEINLVKSLEEWVPAEKKPPPEVEEAPVRKGSANKKDSGRKESGRKKR
eukprot:CAMPEP_0196594362 /NCGR_PEP_ID=MMETSP1081-20130531/78152_1 /TAXON_ID=36882 /ORGANISM="Pyramimonas amylifera, Strain CCMP720" /LENGTH=344 /DNA_ID=CAMNT_0041918613 /DNA_START=49 /DNA_END=1083 /DNA_ORIENTATION=+